MKCTVEVYINPIVLVFQTLFTSLALYTVFNDPIVYASVYNFTLIFSGFSYGVIFLSLTTLVRGYSNGSCN